MHDQGPKPDAKSTKPQNSSVPLRALCGEPVEPWIPESKLPQVPLNPTNSFVRKILLTTPAFPRFYADVVLATRPNSREAKILRPHYQEILEKVNAMSNDRACTHIKVTGVRCNSPALHGEQFCYFHQNAHRGVALHNRASTPEHEALAQQSELPAVSAIPYKPVEPTNPHFWEYSEEGARVLAREAQARKAAEQHVGTAAIGCPAKAKPSASVGTDALVRPGREATVPAAASGTTASVAPPAAVPPHDFKTPQPAPQQNPSPKSQSASSQRKPPETAKSAPQERKNTAHRASGG
jgi:hypothetical protein